jgi:Uncharacterized phage-encoded protein
MSNKEKKNELMVIDEREILGVDVKIYGTVENPLFLAKDVAEWLDYAYKDKNKGTRNVNMMLESVDANEKFKVARLLPSGKIVENWFLTEDGLYETFMLSKKPKAKEFKKELKQVIKQIRLTGGYIPISKEDDEKLILAKAVQILNRTIKEKDSLLEQYQPKVEFYNTLINSGSSFDMKTVAKLLDYYNIGRNRLFQFLRNLKILMKNNEPYQSYIERGWFKVKEKLINGEFIKVTYTTNKGIEGIKKLLEKYGYKKRETKE